MRINIMGFKGEIPKINARLLPEGFAQEATNCRLESGNLVPFRGLTPVHTIVGQAAQSIYLHNGTWLGWTELNVKAVPGPVADERLYVTGSGVPKVIVGGVTYPLHLDTPAAAPSTVISSGVFDPSTAETVLFCYTSVTVLDEESPPSPLSMELTASPNQIITVSGFSAAQVGRGVDRRRIYRSVTSASGITDLFFVAEIALATPSYAHDLAAAPIQNVLPSTDYDQPPADMAGLVAMPNGVMAAFSGREVMFSEPYIPHAWPTKYRLTVDSQVLGLVSFASSLAIITKSTPYMAQGSHPENMQMEKVEAMLPSVSSVGIVDIGYAAVYPSTEGLVMISNSGAQVISKNIMTRDQWRAFVPASFMGSQYNGRYFFSYDIGGGNPRKIGIFDISGEQPFFIQSGVAGVALFTDQFTGSMYLGQYVGGDTVISQWDAPAAVRLTATWKSAVVLLPFPTNFAGVRVESDPTDQTVGTMSLDVIADGVVVRTITTVDTPERLPSGFLAQRWELKITGTRAISAVTLANTFDELMGG